MRGSMTCCSGVPLSGFDSVMEFKVGAIHYRIFRDPFPRLFPGKEDGRRMANSNLVPNKCEVFSA